MSWIAFGGFFGIWFIALYFLAVLIPFLRKQQTAEVGSLVITSAVLSFVSVLVYRFVLYVIAK